MLEGEFDLSDPVILQKVITQIRSMRGEHHFKIVKLSPGRSNKQNRFYFSTCVPAFIRYQRDQGIELNKLQAHEKLKEILLPPGTDTHTMTAEDFSRYYERVIVFLAEMSVNVPQSRSSQPLALS